MDRALIVSLSIFMLAAGQWRSALEKYRGIWGASDGLPVVLYEPVTPTEPPSGGSLWDSMVWNTDDWGS